MKKRLTNCDSLVSKNNEQDDKFHDLINFLNSNSWNIEEAVFPWLAAEEKLRDIVQFLFYLPYLSSIHEKANCIAILWTGSPHSLGSFHHDISINEFRNYVENVLQNSSNLEKAEIPLSVLKAKNIISSIAVSSEDVERGF